MSRIELTRAPSLADKQAAKELFYASPLLERSAPILPEMMWVLLGRQGEAQHEKILPDYCYNIFEAFRATYFKGFPLLAETVQVIDPAGMTTPQTMTTLSKVLRLDWKNLGQLSGIGMRCIRFAQMEAAEHVENDGFNDYTPDEINDLFTVICGRSWVAANQEKIKAEPPDKIFSEMLNQHIATWVAKLNEMESKFDHLAGQSSPDAMVQFSEGFSEGLTSFLGVDGQLAGETTRSGIYGFLLLVWPEIKAMLESDPKKTLSDLHEWMKPFMRQGLTAYIEIDTLRDVCARPPSGIGLSLRPLKTSRPAASA